MLKKFVFSILILFLSISVTADPSDKKFLVSAAKKLISLYSDGVATGEARSEDVFFVNAGSENMHDAFVLFNVGGFQGSNVYIQYLAYFEMLDPSIKNVNGVEKLNPFKLIAVREIGVRSNRAFDFSTAKIVKNELQLSGQAWASNDPGCCPSKNISIKFKLEDLEIVEKQ